LRKKLLLVGWDSADWKIIHPLLDAGELPGLARLVESGVSGNLTTLEPQLSPMLWTSIATGKMAYHHGVPGFTEVDPRSGAVVPVSAATRTCRALWEMLGERGLRSHVVSWFATQGEQHLDGKMVSNMFCHLSGTQKDQDPSEWPAPPPGTYWPPELAETMDDLRVSPHEIDPDEVIRLFVPNAPEVDQTKDKRLWMLAQKLAEAFSTHNAATHLMETDPEWDFMAVYYRAVDEISHLFMPYHAPRMEGIPEADFEMYRNVVNSTYRLHDLFLQRLMQLAGPDTAILLVSDHGFHSDHLRPKFTPRVPAGITVWHRPQGVIAACGPGFKKDELVFGARLLDIAPTVLHYFGLPVGEDMEGRVLEDAFTERRPVATRPTWENPDAPRQTRAESGPDADKALLEQFVALGYIDEIPDDPGQAKAETERENDWNMARACMYGQRYEMALPLLEACYHAQPARTDYAQVLATCQLQLGLLDEADATIVRASETFNRTEQADLIKASIAIQKKDFPAALGALERVREKNPAELQLQLMLAQSYLALRQWENAEAAARQVLTIDFHNPQAFLTLARIQLHSDRAIEALQSALEAIGFQYGNPLGHFLLGGALVQLENFAEAERPLLNCLRLAPKFVRAQRLLARAYRHLGQPDKASICEMQSHKDLLDEKIQVRDKLAALRESTDARAAVRAAEDAIQRAETERLKAEYDAIEPLDFLIVSGLPRSGTSLMMQILQAGGLPLMTDGQRTADEDNPEGYYEWEEIKKLAKNPRLIEPATGKAVKVISALLPNLPGKHRYKILYMLRPVAQVVDSQWAMLARQGKLPKSEKLHLIEAQESHSRQIREVLKKSDRVELLEISFPDLIANPQPILDKLKEFLGEAFTPGPKVEACIKPALHRQRG
jgi:predicted AlkP superfamily phosphohydrolase/phosphomutase/tetratricopeptide (TPR) repeat protein